MYFHLRLCTQCIVVTTSLRKYATTLIDSVVILINIESSSFI